jgi:hypothetical protein
MHVKIFLQFFYCFKMSWTPQQKAFCVIEYAITGSQKAVQIAYCKRFNLRGRARKNVPSHKSIKRWLNEYLERGTSERKKKVSNKWVRTEEQEAAVVDFFRENPTTSVSAAAKLVIEQEDEDENAIEVKRFPSRRTIHRILKVCLKKLPNYPPILRTTNSIRTSFNGINS